MISGVVVEGQTDGLVQDLIQQIFIALLHPLTAAHVIIMVSAWSKEEAAWECSRFDYLGDSGCWSPFVAAWRAEGITV